MLCLAFTQDAFIEAEHHVLGGNTATTLGRGAPLFPHTALDDPRLSRGHARLTREGRSWCVEDLGSRNGTFLNGRRLQARSPLTWGDVLRLGDTLFVFAEAVSDAADARRVPGLVGGGAALARLRQDIGRVAGHAHSVLILGETGTGKEVVAGALHALSGRKGPFVALNCGGVAESVLDSELFGHVRGAFTGAASSRDGLLREAEGGTLFLDELGEMPSTLQVKLLRVLETRAVRALGSDREVAVDVRIVAATHRDLVTRVNEAAFRADLYARLAQWRIVMPPLRERREDLAPLVRHLLGRLGAASRPCDVGLAEALLLHDWPLNVRGLLNLLSMAVIASDGGRLTLAEQVARELLVDQGLVARTPPPDDAAPERSAPLDAPPPPPPAPRLARPAVPPRQELESHLRTHQGNVAEVARLLGCSRQQVYRWIDELGLDLNRYREEPFRSH
ncbi:sigma 54-interacting transcriptional regulator [Corallococcus exiguus]|nr:sigma 54-interacting transcriptional regulator [Corallococcus exiguus]